jgi:hypothetical protein
MTIPLCRALPPAPSASTPPPAAPEGRRITADQWLELRQTDTLKEGEVVTLTFHTSKEADQPCSENNRGTWSCTVLINGKRNGADDQDSIDEELDKAQTTVYMTKIKPDVEVPLTCKIHIDNGYPRLVACT